MKQFGLLLLRSQVASYAGYSWWALEWTLLERLGLVTECHLAESLPAYTSLRSQYQHPVENIYSLILILVKKKQYTINYYSLSSLQSSMYAW